MQKTEGKKKEKGKRKSSGWRWKQRRPVVSWESCSPLCSISVLLLLRTVKNAEDEVEGEEEGKEEG
jgi:hypothetical protein